jgi:hypothetical protein
LTRPNAPFQSINNNAGNKGGDFRLSFTGTCIANVFSECNLFTYIIRSISFRRIFRPSSEAQNSFRH